MNKNRFPLHPSQMEVYLNQLPDIKNPRYNIGGYVKLEGTLDKNKFFEAVHSAPKAFDAFRMRFVFNSDGPVFSLEDDYKKLQVEEVDFITKENPKEAALTWLQTRFDTPFIIGEQEVLFEHALLKVAETEYWFFCKYHHLIIDGFGFTLWVQYLSSKYKSLITGDAFSEIYHSYSEEALKAFDFCNSNEYQLEVKYWEEKLNTKPEKLFSKKYQNNDTGGRSSTFIVEPKPYTRKLFDDLQLETGVSLQQLTIAALIIYFGKTSSTSDFLFGVPDAKRGTDNLRNTVGTFSGTFPFKGRYDKDILLSDFLKEISSTQEKDYQYQNYPAGDLNMHSKANTFDKSYSPDIIAGYESNIGDTDFGIEIKATVLRLATEYEVTPIQFVWVDFGRARPMQLHVRYRNEYFDIEEIELLAGRLIFILEQFPQLLRAQVGTINIVPELELKLITQFNNGITSYPKDKTIVDLFEEQVIKTPDATAVVINEQRLTYKELNERSNQLAHYLRSKHLTEEVFVPICIERCVEMIIGILGILKAGGAYVPIDPEYPEERINYMLDDISAGVAITSTDSKAKLPAGLEKIEIDGARPLIKDEPTTNLQTIIHPHNVAYVIYTSGSTGKPKGVMIEHQNVVRLFTTNTPLYDFNDRDVWTLFHSFSFDFSVWEIFGALFFGGKLVIVPKETTKDVVQFLELILKEKVTVLNQTPSAFYVLQEQVVDKVIEIPVRYVIFGGEALNPAKLQPWKKHYTNCKLINMYGITETTVHVTYQEIGWRHIKGGNSIIGKPIPTLSCYILDHDRNVVPIGVPGELYVGGAGVARGYLNKPELTAERFISNLFSEEQGSRLYKTGDLGRWVPDGNIEYLGRIDEQVKIRGYRIELGEIENVLLQSGLVRQAVVVVKEDNRGNKRLVGYVVAKDKFITEAITSYLHDKLPEYMVPALWVALENLPLTHNGKIDKKALPDPGKIEQLSYRYVAPRNDFETTLATIWQELLLIPKVGIDDNLFELGGDSIITIQIVNRARKSGYQLKPKDLFTHQTIAGLSKLFAKELTNGGVGMTEDAQSGAYKYFVQMKTGKNKIPLYIICGGGGTVFKFTKMVNLLDREQPVFGLQQPTDLKDLEAFPQTIEGIATSYISEILIQNPYGPYALAGHCTGGIIAYEMNKQFEAMGKRVSFLAMFDTIAPQNVPVYKKSLKNLYSIPSVLKKTISTALLKVDFEMFLLRKHTRQAIEYKTKKIRTLINGITGKDNEENDLAVYKRLEDSFRMAEDNYNLTPYNSKIVIYYAKDHYTFVDSNRNVNYRRFSLSDNIKNGWKQYSKSFEIYEVEGEHSTMFDPALGGKELAKLLQGHLNTSGEEL